MNEEKLKSSPAKRGGWLRKLILIGGILLGLVVVAFFVVTSGAFVKSVILPKVGAAMNADLAVADVQLSPFSQLVLHDVKLTPKGAEPLLTAGLVRARYSLFAILRGNILVEEVTVESPTVTIVENADGTSNLDPLLKQLASKKEPTPAAKPSPPPTVDIKSVSLKNATVRRTKNLKGGGREFTGLSNLNFIATNLKNGSSGKMDLSATIALDNAAPGNTGSLSATLIGGFAFDLTADLKPALVNGKAAFKVEKTAGTFSDFSALAATLDCEATPTEVKQMALHFTQSGQALGEMRISGPFDAIKSEGKLNVTVLSLDRRVLNLAGAASGVDFGTTVVNSTNVIEFTKGGTAITASGQLDATSVRITRQSQTTPTLDLRCAYDVTMDRTAQVAVLKTMNLTGMQGARLLLSGALSSPMTILLSGASSAAPDAALNLNLTDLNLADWRAFAADLAPAGLVNLKSKLASQQGGKLLTFDLDGGVRGLGAKFGEQKIADADVKLIVRGSRTGTNQFKLDEYRVELLQQAQPALTLSGSGTFDSATQDADLQVVLKAQLARLLTLFPQPDANLTGGTMELKARVTSKQPNQSVVGQLTLSNLSGRYGTYRFTDFGSAVDLDVAMKAKQVEIRKASGDLRSAGKAGGKFEVTGNFDTARKAGQLAFKLIDFNQDGLRPFLEAALGEKKLVSVSLNTTASASFEASGDATVKGDLQLANLVVSDPKSSSPATPLEAKALVDAAVAKSVAQIRQCVLTLTPTQRAKNELRLSGTVDFSQTNAITGSLKLAADALDMTRYYDLFAGEPKPATPEAPAAPSDNKEPEAVKLPFRNLTFEATIARFYLREVDAANFQFMAKLDGSHVLLKPAQLTLNGAPINATADLDLSVPGFKYDVSFSANGVPVEPLANSFSPTYRGQAKGLLIASGQIKGAGVTGVNLKKTLTGQANLSFTNANIQIVGPKMKKVLSPIAFVLGAPELLSSPLDYLTANLRAGSGKIEVPNFTAHSAAFRAESAGAIPIADVLMDSPLNQDIEISLARGVANKLRFSNVPTNAAYAKLPTFVHLRGTLGSPDPKTDKAVILGLTAAGLGGALGSKTGGLLQSVGGLLGGNLQPASPTTNPPSGGNASAPAATGTNSPPQQQPVNILDLFKKPKKQ